MIDLINTAVQEHMVFETQKNNELGIDFSEIFEVVFYIFNASSINSIE